MPFIAEWGDEPESMEIEGYVILTRSNDDDSCCMVVSCKWGDDYEPDDDWYGIQDECTRSLYQDVNIQWAYHDQSVDSSDCASRVATILLPR